MFASLVLVLFFSHGAFTIQNYCSLNTYETNGTYMQFIKEPSVEEFAIVGKFKGLHCCAKGYRSIEWYKDGKPYPWPLTQSQLILYPESANQTVYTKRVTEVDAGNYTCLLRNDTTVHSHTIQLKVFEKSPDDPKITYISPDTEIPVGYNLRLFCEAFAGRVDLPDAHNEVVWRKVGHNRTLDDEPHIRQEKNSREDGQTFGTYLIMENVRPEDYGEYICKITKPGRSIEQHVFIREKVEVKYLNPNPIPIGKMLLYMSAILFLCVAVLLLNLKYGLPLRVRFKDSFGLVEENDGKSNDALILYAPKDAEIALGVLLPTLETRYGYKCEAKEYPVNINQWFTCLQTEANRSRRNLALISPAALNDTWDSSTLYKALKQLHSIGNLTCIMMKRLPIDKQETKNDQGETLASLLRSTHYVNWERAKDENFWLSLRLRLPPKPRGVANAAANAAAANYRQTNASRLTSDSDESLDNFV